MMEWENKLYQILLKEQEAEAVVDDWVERNIQSDLRLRRAKTKGHVVIETRDVMFARNIHPLRCLEIAISTVCPGSAFFTTTFSSPIWRIPLFGKSIFSTVPV